MKIRFIAAELHFNPINTDLQQAIQAHLKTQGEPLRWSITAVEGKMVSLEAVVLQDVDELNH
jgi:hypothetical protein